MEYIMKDRMAQTMGMTLHEVKENGIVTRAESRIEFCNPFGVIHGGYSYAMGHISAIMTAELVLGKKAVVVEATSQYLAGLQGDFITCETELLSRGPAFIICRATVSNGDGRPCFKQQMILWEMEQEEELVTGKQPSLFHNTGDSPVDEKTGLVYPKLVPYFSGICHCYMVGRGEHGLKYAVDLLDDIYNPFGAAHGGAIYAGCDAAAGESALAEYGSKTVTVSSTIAFMRPAKDGPLSIEPRVSRNGRRLVYYDMDIHDIHGNMVATAQFTMQKVNYEQVNFPKG